MHLFLSSFVLFLSLDSLPSLDSIQRRRSSAAVKLHLPISTTLESILLHSRFRRIPHLTDLSSSYPLPRVSQSSPPSTVSCAAVHAPSTHTDSVAETRNRNRPRSSTIDLPIVVHTPSTVNRGSKPNTNRKRSLETFQRMPPPTLIISPAPTLSERRLTQEA